MKTKLLLVIFLLTRFGSLFSEPVPAGWEQFGLETAATGEWWELEPKGRDSWLDLVNVPRDETVAFALYTTSDGTLKLSAQLYPLLDGEDRFVRLEIMDHGKWVPIDVQPVVYPGWSAHFRIENWDDSKDVRYRVRHGKHASFEGLIRRNPREKEEIVVASLSCNSRKDRGEREAMVSNLAYLDPDVLFFAGDQSYDHKEHTAAWLLWGRQFREVLGNRPVITIPDDHDIGQANLWGEGGIPASDMSGVSGGYFLPASYVNMVQRCQTWHLPDPFDPTPVEQGIGVYYTSLNVGGVDFAILEDRKFKTGPAGKIPRQGPRADHVNDPDFDPDELDLPGLKLLGDRQLHFLRQWGEDWTDAVVKCVLSQTNFSAAATHHGEADNYLQADLDSNAWPQSGRRKALVEIRKAGASHLAGDQHLAVVVQHGIDEFRDGPFTLLSPAIFNNFYSRFWNPGKPGLNPIEDNDLEYTGDYFDGFGNRFTMLAYANPPFPFPESRMENRGGGFSVARFNKREGTITFECWPRICDARKGDHEQYKGWPVQISMDENDGREPSAWLPRLDFSGVVNPVVQVVKQASGEVLYTRRIRGTRFSPPVFAEGSYTIRVGYDRPDKKTISNVLPSKTRDEKVLPVSLSLDHEAAGGSAY